MATDFKEALCEGAQRIGIIAEVNVPSELPLRWIWCYYQPDNFTPGAITDIVLVEPGNRSVKIPALRVTAAGSRYGLAANAQALLNTPTWPSANTPLGSDSFPAASPSPFSLFFKPPDSYAYNHYFIAPIQLPSNCISVRLESNNAATYDYGAGLVQAKTWALLQVFSSDIPKLF